ncbi:MAG: M48 family metalloprotease [Candidatus Omnitrophica bacterium]|nr:M48 family metalloprotease [Candidatus Omnitrophota bacterium]
MAFSFIEIEEKKNKLVFVLFFVLMLFYFFIAWLLIIPFKLVFFSKYLSETGILPNLKETLLVFIAALVAGALHWIISTNQVISKALSSLGAKPLDEKDSFHLRLKNITEEASIASGGRKVECWIMPSSALNAFAMSDFSDRAVVGVTEGLLAKLNRAQMEAVVAHEFGHILNGDSKMTTITASLFGVYSALMDGIRRIFEGNRHLRVRNNGAGAMVIFLMLVYAILAVTKFMSSLLNLFISRQREFRADAISVRLTRNPLALAEALHIISRGWRGAYLSSEYLSSIFIINPVYSYLDETEGFLSTLFSTHPPINKRIGIALDMAHLDVKNMIEEMEKKHKALSQRTDSVIVELEEQQERWFAVGPDGQWQGPFLLADLTAIDWFKGESWVHKESESKIQFAWQNNEIRNALQGKINPDKKAGKSCPRCNVQLSKVLYEGTPILHCSSCSGNLLEREKIVRVLTRRLLGFSPQIEQMARAIMKTVKDMDFYKKAREGFRSVQEFSCPECGRTMGRQFYNMDYIVEIDLCLYCDIIWFDKDELEILQFLHEKYNDGKL